MQSKYSGTIKLLVVIAITIGLVWFLIISPSITFKNNEEKIKEAAKRYYEFYSTELPTGERVKTLSLSVLYKKAFLKENFFAPISNKACSVENSWVKVKRVSGHYTYYVYLDCGALKSRIDHTGPVIKLKGDEEISISIDEEYKELGVSSIVDDHDGKLSTDSISIKGEVDNTKVGTYEIEYTAHDSLMNKTTVIRKVNVVKVFKDYVKKDLGEATIFKGNPLNNYVRLSNMYFRIIGLDKNENVILVAEEDVANVSYDKLEKWLDEVYIPHFTKEAKKYIVKSQFCKMKIDNIDAELESCSTYTDKRYAYVASTMDIKAAQDGDQNFLKPLTISWTADSTGGDEAYITRNVFYGSEYGKSFITVKSSYNYGVRPKIIIKGTSLLTGGDGTHDDPYVFGEVKKAKGGSLLNNRYSGEYIIINGFEWRIMDTLEDGTTKVISDDTLGNQTDRPITYTNPEDAKLTFNPKDKENYAYYINNKASKYIDTVLLTMHEFEVPIYKKEIIYGEEKKVEKYRLKIAPPNMFDMFTAQSTTRAGKKSHSYWLINSSTSKERYCGAVTDIGVVLNEPIEKYGMYGVRAVGYIKSGTVISSGDGTYSSPYKLK